MSGLELIVWIGSGVALLLIGAWSAVQVVRLRRLRTDRARALEAIQRAQRLRKGGRRKDPEADRLLDEARQTLAGARTRAQALRALDLADQVCQRWAR